MKCCGCARSSTAVSDPQEVKVMLDLSILEAKEKSLRIGMRAPRSGTKIAGVRVRGPFEFRIAVFGGPYSDVLGAKEECIRGVACGTSAVHEVFNLQPETEYTIQASLTLPSYGELLAKESVEARTAPATTSLFAGEDWGRSCGAAFSSKDGSKNCSKGGQATEKEAQKNGAHGMSSTSASSSSAAAPAAAGPTPVGRADTQDDVSTNAPEDEAGENAGRRFDDNASQDSDPEVELEQPELSSSPAAASGEDLGPCPAEPIAEEVEVIQAAPKRGMECKLCSMWDCLKTSSGKGGAGQTDPHDLVIQHTSRASRSSSTSVSCDAAVAAPKAVAQPQAGQRRVFRPYRIPFPGTPVDPRSVGLDRPQFPPES